MSRRQTGSLLLSLGAAGAFIASFMTPFVSSDFDPKIPKKLSRAVDSSMRQSNAWLDRLEALAGQGARDQAQKIGRYWMDLSLEKSLGEVGKNAKGEGISWSRCMESGEGAASPGWKPCVKAWMTHKAGIPVGIQTLPGVIAGLFQRSEWILGLLLVLFSLIFPAAKILLSGILALGLGRLRGRERLRTVLAHTSKWSMTDVFVVALLIVFFKAESFNFRFEAEIGVYLFAVAAIASSLAIMLLPSATVGAEQAQEEEGVEQEGEPLS